MRSLALLLSRLYTNLSSLLIKFRLTENRGAPIRERDTIDGGVSAEREKQKTRAPR